MPIISAASIALVACSSGSGSSTATPAAVTDGTATARPVATQPATPVVSDGVYSFADKGYSIKPPEGWQLQPNAFFDPSSSVFPADAFFAPDKTSGIQPNITVQCRKPQPAATTGTFRDSWVQLVSQLAKAQVQAMPTTVDGHPAYRMSYLQPITTAGPGEATAQQKTDVVLVEGKCAWVVSLTAPADPPASLGDAFNQAVNSLKLSG